MSPSSCGVDPHKIVNRKPCPLHVSPSCFSGARVRVEREVSEPGKGSKHGEEQGSAMSGMGNGVRGAKGKSRSLTAFLGSALFPFGDPLHLTYILRDASLQVLAEGWMSTSGLELISCRV